jgi:DNA-binding transcriptional ArsR family regulator
MVKIVRRKVKLTNTGLRERPLHGRQFLLALKANGGWMSPHAVAAACGSTWQTVSHWLTRMVDAGMVEREVVDHPGSARSLEQHKRYRSRPDQGEVRRVNQTLPAWLAPQAIVAIGELRRVDGAAGLRRGDEERQSSGGPNGPVKGAASTKPTSAPVGSTDDEDGG